MVGKGEEGKGRRGKSRMRGRDGERSWVKGWGGGIKGKYFKEKKRVEVRFGGGGCQSE